MKQPIALHCYWLGILVKIHLEISILYRQNEKIFLGASLITVVVQLSL